MNPSPPEAPRGAAFIGIDDAWLARRVEEILEPDLPIIDAHHHAWERKTARYLLPEIVADVSSGHRIVSTVFVESGGMYRSGGPQELRSLGETEFANGLAAMSASGQYGSARICEAIIGRVDLRLAAGVTPILEKHIAVTDGRFRGVRYVTAWHESVDVRNPLLDTYPKMLEEPEFRRGFRELVAMGLSFDAWVYHPQIPEVKELARDFPEATIILNHMGGLVGIGPYAGSKREARADWQVSMQELAACPNVLIKLGGGGMRLSGYDFHERAKPPGSEELASLWAPTIETCINAFGPKRCMFESNFPGDKGSCSYHVLWNAFKRITAGFSAGDKAQLYHRTASDAYRLQAVK